MLWWHWVLIGIGVVALATLKFKVLGKMMRKKKSEVPDEDG